MSKTLLSVLAASVLASGALGGGPSDLTFSPLRAAAEPAAQAFTAHAVSVNGSMRQLAAGQPSKTLDDYNYLTDSSNFFNGADYYTVDGVNLGISVDVSFGEPLYLYKSGTNYYSNLIAISFSFFDYWGIDDNLFDVSIFDPANKTAYDGFYFYDKTERLLYVDPAVAYTQSNVNRGFSVGIITDDAANSTEVEELYTLASASPENDSEQFLYELYGLKNAEKFLDRNNVEHNVPGDVSRDVYLDLDNPLTEVQILSQFSAVDVFGTPCKLTKVSSNYPAIPTAGTYTLVYSAADSYSNTATLTIKAHVLNYRPVIEPKTGASNKVTVDYSSGATIAQIISFFKATSYDGRDLKLELKAGQTFDRTKIGETSYTLITNDGRNHSTEYEIIVDISQNVPPTVIFSDAIIVCDVNNPLSLLSVKQILQLQLGVTGFEDLTIESPYFDKTKQPAGSYKVSYSGTTDEGDAIAGVVTLKAEDFSDSGHSHNPLCFFKSLWAAICRGFTSWKWYWEWVE